MFGTKFIALLSYVFIAIGLATASVANNETKIEQMSFTKDNCWRIKDIHTATKVVLSKHVKASVNSISFMSAGWKDTPASLKDVVDPKFYHGFCLITADTARGAVEFNLDHIIRAYNSTKELYFGYADTIW